MPLPDGSGPGAVAAARHAPDAMSWFPSLKLQAVLQCIQIGKLHATDNRAEKMNMNPSTAHAFGAEFQRARYMGYASLYRADSY